VAEINAGTIVDGRYKIVSRLGAGGMADVYLAEDQQLGRKVALKLLHGRFAEDPGFVERFRREAQAAAGLQHPNVVSVYDRGDYDDTYYIAMEYLPGRSLKQLIRQEAPLDPVRAIDITIQILKAARFAHRRGVIHRDLKPHNVIVDDSDHAKVTDFGIARAGASDMTETGSIMGTAQYLSPEQAQGHAVSAGSDLYSVGVVLYELLTGRVPFDAEAAVTIALKHVSEQPARPTAINPAIPPELEQIVMWALNKNASDRPADADQFIAALEHAKASLLSGSRGEHTVSMPALAGVAGGAAVLPPPADASPPAAPPILPSAGLPEGMGDGNGGYPSEEYEPLPPPEHRRWPWIVLILVLLLGGAAVATYFLTRPQKKIVPAVAGLSLNAARTILQNDGFSVGAPITVTSTRPSGIVIGENPQGGSKVDEGSNIALTVSSGPGNVSVPAVGGQTLAQAKKALTKAGLKVGQVIPQTSTQVPDGRVIDTQPAAGSNPMVGTPVTIFVSSGKPLVNVPDVTGQSQSAGKTTLENAGFKVVSTDQASATVKSGNVISQNPAGNTQAAQNSTVNIVISTGPPSVSVPRVINEPPAAATSTLEAAGFKVAQTTKSVTRAKRNGLVVEESPTPGSTAKQGSTVTIFVGVYTPPSTSTTTTPTTSTPTTTTTGTGSATST
jgi:beta-lactam-binding protein with PASTA domain